MTLGECGVHYPSCEHGGGSWNHPNQCSGQKKQSRKRPEMPALRSSHKGQGLPSRVTLRIQGVEALSSPRHLSGVHFSPTT